MVTSKRAERQWDRANASYENYLACIPRHRGRYRLTLSDLLHVRNFKGGNASVHVPQRELSRKLECWSGHLRKLAQLCDGRELRDLPSANLARVQRVASAFLELVDAGPRTSTGIFGFRASHASVLLHTRFPDLLPILDSRVLKGSGIIQQRRRAEAGDYPSLVDQCRRELRARPGVTMRELDREFFVRG